MLPNNHAIHDNNYGELYNFNFVAKLGLGGRHRNKAVTAMHFLVIFAAALPPSELERVFLVPARHPSCREKRSSLLVFSFFFVPAQAPGTRHLAH